MSGEQLAQAAQALVGVRFRLHGRDPASGLDCVGVVAAALAAIDRPARAPNGYTLRMRALPDLDTSAAALGLVPATGPVRPGDVLALRPGPCQLHLAIAAAPKRIIHAHAGLRRVVLGPVPPDWAEIRRWRLGPSAIPTRN